MIAEVRDVGDRLRDPAPSLAVDRGITAPSAAVAAVKVAAAVQAVNPAFTEQGIVPRIAPKVVVSWAARDYVMIIASEEAGALPCPPEIVSIPSAP